MPRLREVKKGEKFGYWTALGESEHRGRIIYDKCQCICGIIKFVHHDHLIHGKTTNCGCKMYEIRSKNGKRNRKHGLEGTAFYRKFMGAKSRCNNKNNDSYYRYGGRGIRFEWTSFEGFLEDMLESYKRHCEIYGEENTTLDRINVDGNYCKDNCRRATREEQYNNMSTNHKVVYRGKEYNSISLLCKATGTKYPLVRDRIRLGWTIKDAIERPLIQTKKYVKKGEI